MATVTEKDIERADAIAKVSVLGPGARKLLEEQLAAHREEAERERDEALARLAMVSEHATALLNGAGDEAVYHLTNALAATDADVSAWLAAKRREWMADAIQYYAEMGRKDAEWYVKAHLSEDAPRKEDR